MMGKEVSKLSTGLLGMLMLTHSYWSYQDHQLFFSGSHFVGTNAEIRKILTNSPGSLHSNCTGLFCHSEGTWSRSILLHWRFAYTASDIMHPITCKSQHTTQLFSCVHVNEVILTTTFSATILWILWCHSDDLYQGCQFLRIAWHEKPKSNSILQFFLRLRPSNCLSVLTLRKSGKHI